MIVVRPTQSQSILPGLLDPGGPVSGLPVGPFSLEDKMTCKVPRACHLDDPIESFLGDVEPFGVVLEASTATLPELLSLKGVPSRVWTHPTLPGEIARKRIEPR